MTQTCSVALTAKITHCSKTIEFRSKHYSKTETLVLAERLRTKRAFRLPTDPAGKMDCRLRAIPAGRPGPGQGRCQSWVKIRRRVCSPERPTQTEETL